MMIFRYLKFAVCFENQMMISLQWRAALAMGFQDNLRSHKDLSSSNRGNRLNYKCKEAGTTDMLCLVLGRSPSSQELELLY